MYVPFPTRETRPYALGTPDRAVPCRCHHALVEDDGCVVCGHWLEREITWTWLERAAVVACPEPSLN